jgi:anaerobic magnesium-protoporphyrin IX monomethyl ester cyclase
MCDSCGVSMPKIQNAGRTLRIALVIPPPQKPGPIWCPNLPIGIAYLTAVLEKSGYNVTVIDCPALGIDHENLGAKIATIEPSVVGITSVTPMIQSALLAAHVAKEKCPNAIVILGGPHVTFMDKQILSENSEVDVVVRGEGEQTLLELMRHVSNFGDLHEIAGITFRNNGRIIRTPNRPFIQNLDELPRPAYEHFPLRKYRLFGKAVLPIMTSRGCPFQCSYCVSSRMNGIRFRARSPKNVVDELEWLRDTHGADAFSFYDDAFTLDIARACEICEEIKNRNIGLPWDCQTRVDQITKEVLAKMREANCQLVSFGVESGNQKILNAVKKRTTIEQNERAIRWAKEAGLPVAMSVIIGYPGETTDTLKQTLDFIRRTEPDYVYLCLATPYPGTELRELVKELGWKMSREWSQYDLQTPVFENPLLPNDKLMEARKKFYNDFYSPSYILRQSSKGNFYSQIMAHTALNYILWRIKLSKFVPAILRRSFEH